MTEDPILITNLNDFEFCPVSIYFHGAMGNMDRIMTQSKCQIDGTNSHSTVDDKRYSTRADVLQGIDVYCERYGLIGKIDVFDSKNGVLTERKKRVKRVYDGFVFQLYAQYFALTEMGYDVTKLRLHSMDDNKTYDIPLPKDDPRMLSKFETLVDDIHSFDPDLFSQNNPEKCANCIYEVMCGSSARF